MTEDEDIKEWIIESILQKLNGKDMLVTTIVLGASRAKGTHTEDSDYDLTALISRESLESLTINRTGSVVDNTPDYFERLRLKNVHNYFERLWLQYSIKVRDKEIKIDLHCCFGDDEEEINRSSQYCKPGIVWLDNEGLAKKLVE